MGSRTLPIQSYFPGSWTVLRAPTRALDLTRHPDTLAVFAHRRSLQHSYRGSLIVWIYLFFCGFSALDVTYQAWSSLSPGLIGRTSVVLYSCTVLLTRQIDLDLQRTSSLRFVNNNRIIRLLAKGDRPRETAPCHSCSRAETRMHDAARSL